MSRVQIYEKLNNVNGDGFKKVRSDDGFIRLSGVFAQTSIKNRNNRTYTTENYAKMLDGLKKRIAEEGCPGELEHPTTMNIDYNNVSHMVESVDIDENGVVTGTIKLLDTPKGKIAQALVEGGLPLFVSSRATGDVDQNGVVTLEELKTYDLVGTPGFVQARLHCNESMVTESIDDDMFLVYEKKEETNKPENNMNKENNVPKTELEVMTEKFENLQSYYRELLKETRSLRNQYEDLKSLYENVKTPEANVSEGITEEDVRKIISETVTENLKSFTDNLADGIEKWIVEEYSPEIEKWIVEEYSPEVENWLNEEYKPENLKPFIEENINNSIKESKESKLSNIDSLLEMLDNVKSQKPVFESATPNEPYFIAAMPENLRPLWESASDEMKTHITEKAKMYTLNTDDKIRFFWENKVDFKKELEPVKNINEGLDTITDQFEKNLRMALRKR